MMLFLLHPVHTSLLYKWISVYIIIISICFGLESSSQTKPYCQCCYWRFTSGSAEEPTNYIVCRYSSGNANGRRMNRVQVRPSCLSNQDKHSIHAPVMWRRWRWRPSMTVMIILIEAESWNFCLLVMLVNLVLNGMTEWLTGRLADNLTKRLTGGNTAVWHDCQMTSLSNWTVEFWKLPSLLLS